MLVRVGEVGKPAFQLRPGEKGISIFDTLAVTPELTEEELLAVFRPGSILIEIDGTQIEARGLEIVAVPGGDRLGQRLSAAHAEIRPGPDMTRAEFKRHLKELEDHAD